ncbi:ABC transporter ATP-binding protein [Limoniibacter endophyticus]|uniref:ATP-binding protein n=1 Tax=Limoniibacter endophyticus TaxID=1565040 RepID=A0A8J3DJV8_9HYPH|nr:ABC transporter ATP-binding protein [Limoniibacter endophyticus]GHC79767.1 ATP-binding protein [Limoniibacter endophyticus]
MIELRSITKIYGENIVVDSVSMTIEPRTLTAIVGTSGSGKTTLLRMINRLVEPTSGDILIDGANVRDVAPYELRRRIGYAIQGYGLFPHRTVAENIATVPQLLKWDRNRIAARVDELLALFQLDPADFAGRYPHELSGGQQQRVGVARALAAKPNILLMDEPFGALDPIIRAKAQEDLKHIQRQTDTTVVLVTHDMDEALGLGDKVAVMDGGKLVQYSVPDDILLKPATPFVEQLVGSGDKALRLLALRSVDPLVENGHVDGDPITTETSQRDALSEILWRGTQALPVVGEEGAEVGIVSRDSLLNAAERRR